MADVRMETLQPRWLLSTVVINSTLRGDSHFDSTVDFGDLLALAQNYNPTTGTTWGAGDTNYSGAVDFSDLLALAYLYNYNSKPTAEDSVAFVNDKGKLFIDMGNRSDLRITQEGKTTHVVLSLTHLDPLANSLVPIVRDSFRNVRSIEVQGTERPDRIMLGPGLQTTTIFARGGNDLILGRDEDAIIHGGDGNDTVYAGGGNDTVYGDAGDDRIYGSSGNDFLDGGAGKDRLDGGKGKNKLIGGSGTDYLFVRAGKDHVVRDVKDRLTDVIG